MKQNERRRQIVLYAAGLLFLWLAQSTPAQVTTATIRGVVRDESGAVLPGATVTARNVETGVARTVTSGSNGQYRVPQLALGSYEVEAQQKGFQTELRKGIVLTIGREAVVDFSLQVGAVVESVSVTAEAPLIETTNSSVANLVDSKSIEMLPLNGRDLTQLATLQPGVTLTTTASSSTTSGPAKKVSVAGSRPNQSSYLLDGMDIINNTGKGVSGVSGQFLGVDAVREFNVLSSNYSAEYGRAAGGVINVVTKSGTNKLHGSAFEYLRNDNLDARNFFDRAKPEFKRNQFGGAAGGPIRKDKSFFFGSYEGFRETLGLTSIGFVPTADSREGRLPGQTVAVDPRIRPLLAIFPLPNRLIFSDGTGEYISAQPQTTSENYVSGRIDQYFSPSDSFFGRYTLDDGTKTLPYFGSDLPGFGLPLRLRGQYISLQETKVISASLINVARLGVNRTHYSGRSDFDIPELRFYPGRPIGQVTTTGLAALGAGVNQPFDHPITVIDYADDMSWIRGRHAIKTGFLGRRYLWGFQRDFRLNGTYSFTSLANLLRNSPQTFQGILLGSPDTRRHYRQSMYGMYLQDDIQVNANLTLNVGLRYEFISNPTEATGPRLAFIPRDWDQTKSPNGILTDRIFEENPSLKNFSPRFGLAWNLFGNGKTSLRGGWAFLFDQIYPLYYENQRIPPLVLTVDLRSVTYPNPFGNQTQLATLSPTAMDYFNRNTPSVMQFNVLIQHELLPAMVVGASYIASRSYHLPLANDVNTVVPEFLPDGRTFFRAGNPLRNPSWGRTSILEWAGQAFYNSLNLTANRRWGNGFQINGNYTFARNVDDGSGTIGGDFSNSTRQRQNPYNKLADRGLASMHIAHAFNVSYVVDLPFGPGRRYGGQLSGVGAKLLAGWQVQGITSGNSGPPFTVDIGSVDRSRSANLADRPDLAPGRSNNPVLGGPSRYLDTTAFALQTPGFFGNLGRNTVIGPGRLTFDFSMIKTTPIREGFSAQFRAEVFNIANRANFDIPGRTVFTASGTTPASAGRITSTTTSARQIQFGLKLVF